MFKNINWSILIHSVTTLLLAFVIFKACYINEKWASKWNIS